MNTRFMIWWLAAVIQVIGVAVAIHFGAIDFLLASDQTYLSFVTTAMWAIGTITIGYLAWIKENDFDTPWFIAESCISVGMIGTLIGFMLMLSSSLGNVDPSNIESMKQVIGDMATGMSTALVTTLSGLVFSLFLKIQITIQEHKLAE
tara:strand:- start:455 stop:898 length:444 start_codon:yes stop_codon:yes gene_type:complete